MKVFIFTFIVFSLGWWSSYVHTYLYEKNKEKLSNAVLDKIRNEIERLHYHPKLDFIKNDEVVEMALEVIDKYR